MANDISIGWTNDRTRGATVLALVLAGLMVAACGGDKGGSAATDAAGSATAAGTSGATDVAPPAPAVTDPAAVPAPGTAAVVPAESREATMATAVADSKTSAPIDLLYDLPAKPEIGQPFVLELAVKPRLPGVTLDVEIGDSPGIVVVDGERKARFPNPEGGQSYTYKLKARGDTQGIYYVTVMATLSTSVQSESRVFSVPVVIGNPVAQQKPAPKTDASGQAIESMPAKEQ